MSPYSVIKGDRTTVHNTELLLTPVTIYTRVQTCVIVDTRDSNIQVTTGRSSIAVDWNDKQETQLYFDSSQIHIASSFQLRS